MRKKKIIAIILAAVLVAAGLGSFAYANPDPVNEVSAMFSTQWYYDVPGDAFLNHEVEGHEDFFAQMENDQDGTEADVTGLTLTLATETEFNFFQEENLVLSGPPTWEWDFDNVPEWSYPIAWVGFRGPTQPVVPLTPGFDASRLLSETEFLQSEGTQIQTLTITLTPQEDEVMTEGGWFSIGVGAEENELVNAVITSPTGGDGHRLNIQPTGLELDKEWTIDVTIEVTPKVPKVEFMPFVDIKWFGPPSDSGSTTESWLSYPVPEVGTWTWSAEPWSAEGSYEWHWAYHMARKLQWHPCSREIPVNIVSLEYRTFRFYAAPGDTFDNREVTGSTWWYTNAHNYPDGTEEPITGLELSLDSNLSLDWRRWFMKTILTEVPPTYEWSVGDVLEDEHVPVVVHPRGPDEVLATFTPGFDASVSVDRVKFSQSEGTQTQTLTIEVTPLEDVNVAVCADEGTFSLFMPADKGDLVEAKITSFPSGGTALEDGHTFYMPISGGETTTIELGIEVTPKVPRAEYKPAVAVMSPPEGTYPAGEPHLGSSHSLEVDSLGTWTWSAVGEYNWTWNYVVLEGVMFAGISSAIEDFHVGERWSLTVRGRFDETGRHASGTWEISSEGTICAEGTWEASAP